MKPKKRLVTLICAALFGTATIASAEPSSDKTALIRLEIKQLVDNYAVYRDSKNAEGYANLFAEDGKFYYRGDVYQGREALAERIEAVDPNSNTMHVMTSGQISILDDKTATGVHYATIYSKTREESADASDTLTIPNFAIMGKYHDKYVLTNEGWKFAERRIEPVFSPAE